ncbi:hypothetical protein [Haloprofundus salilacus]|uniref:hypothetical protein n=1 Tax=Haloprofundus salilacus TaxID=2876190 RepID=UPI001CCBCDB5|nr:hypothetical protein [Haloprofundus salilacus]
MYSRRKAFQLVGATVTLGGFFGCLGVFQDGGVSDKDVKERALSAEERYVTTQLKNASCVNDWGLNSYIGFEKEAQVTNRSTDGVDVEVSQPYWYSTDEDDADTGSKATYFVTVEDIQRTSGDKVSPC